MSEVKDQKTMPVAESYDDMKLEDAMRRLDEVVSALDRENTDLERHSAYTRRGFGWSPCATEGCPMPRERLKF